MNPDQTSPKGAVWCGSILFATKATKACKQGEDYSVTLSYDPHLVLKPFFLNTFLPLVAKDCIVTVTDCSY